MKFMGIAIIIVLVIGAGVIFYAWTGWYHIGATVPHWNITSELIEMVRDRSIVSHSDDIRMSDLDKAELRRHAMPHYHEMCRYCHGAPGYAAKEFSAGLYPAPPKIAESHIQEEWSDAELYWIVKHGIKMTGMPAFGPTHSEKELWGLVALTGQIPRMTPDQYRQEIKRVSIKERRQGEGHHNSKAEDPADNGHDREMTPEEEDTGHHH